MGNLFSSPTPPRPSYPVIGNGSTLTRSNTNSYSPRTAVNQTTSTPVNWSTTPITRTITPVNRTTTPINRTTTPINRITTPINRTATPITNNSTGLQNGGLSNHTRQNNRNSFQNRRTGNRRTVPRDYSAPNDDFEDLKEHRIERSRLFLYHYTNFESALGIIDSGVLKASQSGAYGLGVYLTDLRPWQGKERLLSNNWCEGPDSSFRSRATVCFEFIADQIKAVRKCQDRKIWTVPNDISLPAYRPKLFLVFDDKDTTGKREKIKKINELKRDPDTYNKIRQLKVTFL